MEKNKTGKYLKYAIGEIVLVVLGILIALQINNWNERQKQLRLEKEILKEVRIGLEADNNSIQVSINDHEKFINSQNIIVNWMYKKLAYHDSLMPHFKHTHWTTLFVPKDAQFESLKQFGLRNISNKKLSDQISNLYDNLYEDVLLWQDEYKNTSYGLREHMTNGGIEFVQDSSDILLDQRPLNPTDIQNNSAFLFQLIGTSSTLKLFNEYKLKATQEEIEKTIIMIDEELAKH
ncbi:MAG: hypothetical protein HKN52_12930 [Eudoraea sp.]|nr:hypothetical protein [Eudoraea sp.]